MKRSFRILYACIGLLLILSSCEMLGLSKKEPLTLSLATNRAFAYNLQTFSLTATIPQSLEGKVRFKWYEGNNTVPFLNETWTRISLVRYVDVPTDFLFTVKASDGTSTATESVTITVAPYAGSDSATITLVNNKGINVSEVYVNLSQAMDNPVASPLLGPNLLTNGASKDFLHLVPGWYMIGCASAAGQSSGQYGTQINAGNNTVNLQ